MTEQRKYEFWEAVAMRDRAILGLGCSLDPSADIEFVLAAIEADAREEQARQAVRTVSEVMTPRCNCNHVEICPAAVLPYCPKCGGRR